MPRPRKPKAVEEQPTNNLLDALKFLSCVTKEQGAVFETHVLLKNGTATAFNGIVAAGQKINEDIHAAPNNKLLIEALSKCGQNLSITQLDNNRLSIKSDKFKAIVPCVDPSQLALVEPDAPIAPINDEFKEAIEAVGILANENGQRVVELSILMNGRSCIATNGFLLFEYWHGLDLPPDLPLPKAFMQPLLKNNKKLSKFGFSNASATFWFEDESWIRTQLFKDKWPDLSAILNTKNNPVSIPTDMYKGIEAVMNFSANGLIYFDGGVIRSHNHEAEGASYEVNGLPKGPIYNAKQLMMIKPYIKTIDFFADQMTVFYGDKIRGFIAGRRE